MKNKMIYLVGLAVVLLTVAGCSASSSSQDKKGRLDRENSSCSNLFNYCRYD